MSETSVTCYVHLAADDTPSIWDEPETGVVHVTFNGGFSIFCRNWQHLTDLANDMLNAARVHLDEQASAEDEAVEARWDAEGSDVGTISGWDVT